MARVPASVVVADEFMDVLFARTKLPALRPLYSEAWACVASSIARRPWRRAMSRMESISATRPWDDGPA